MTGRGSAGTHRPLRRWGMVILIAVIALAAGLGQTSLGHAVLGRAGLFEEPTSYTSLAFVNPQPPEQLNRQHQTIDVSFMIHNASNAPRDYQWSVSLVQRQGTSHVAEGNVRIASEHGAVITRSATVSCAKGTVQIVVSLARPAEYIDALTSCPQARR